MKRVDGAGFPGRPLLRSGRGRHAAFGASPLTPQNSMRMPQANALVRPVEQETGAEP